LAYSQEQWIFTQALYRLDDKGLEIQVSAFLDDITTFLCPRMRDEVRATRCV